MRFKYQCWRSFLWSVLLQGLVYQNSMFGGDTQLNNEFVSRLKGSIYQVASNESAERVKELRALDDELRDQDQKVVDQWSPQVLKALALAKDFGGIEHVRAVFEAQPERRHDAAAALGARALQRDRDEADWRLLVRSLPTVEGEPARQVMRGLAKYRLRATRPKWVRRVIVLGLQMPNGGDADAVALLKNWLDVKVGGDSAAQLLAGYQDWFREKYPSEPPAELFQPAPGSRWALEELRQQLGRRDAPGADKSRGQVLYEKHCAKCHRFEKLGQMFGPDLTSVAWRMQRGEMVAAILAPSAELSDEYQAMTLLSVSGTQVSGLLRKISLEVVVVLQADGREVTVPRKEVEEIIPSRISLMPDGLLNSLSATEIADLFAFLCQSRAGTPPRDD